LDRPEAPAGTEALELSTDNLSMYISPFGVKLLIFIVALIVLTLYIMRRRVRLGRRKGKF